MAMTMTTPRRLRAAGFRVADFDFDVVQYMRPAADAFFDIVIEPRHADVGRGFGQTDALGKAACSVGVDAIGPGLGQALFGRLRNRWRRRGHRLHHRGRHLADGRRHRRGRQYPGALYVQRAQPARPAVGRLHLYPGSKAFAELLQPRVGRQAYQQARHLVRRSAQPDRVQGLHGGAPGRGQKRQGYQGGRKQMPRRPLAGTCEGC